MNLPRVRAPRLPSDPALWLNTGGEALPIAPGTVYLLDFWTYGCLNCVHVLPDLAYLEARYRDRPFAVIGVHSGKFAGEKGAENVRHAIARHGIRHPVVLDDDYSVWKAYAVRAWPTFVIIDARGYVVGATSGEGNREVLTEAIDALFARDEGSGSVTVEAPLSTEGIAAVHDYPLRYPGRVLADAAGGRLFVADSGHNRIVIAPLHGGLRHDDYTYAGSSGQPGFADGGFAGARFRDPQGMALSRDGGTLFVADAGNHAIRALDLAAGTVATVAGTGRQAVGPVRTGPARETDLNSPWGLTLSPDGRTLFIAMAGSHQIVALSLDGGTVAPRAGTGREARADGPALDAAFAQPSGITSDGETLFVADAESSCIRRISGNEVRTVAGGDLFDFGFADGTGDAARFQHPLDVAYHAGSGQVYVADAYNHRIRRVAPDTGETATVAGSGETNELYEPGGVSVAEDSLYIADTNRHRVRRLDLATGRLEDVPLPGLCSPTLCFPETERAAL